MRIQSAGRLGNILFIWAYAIHLTQHDKIKVRIFSDRYHSEVSADSAETRKYLSGTRVEFYNSNLLGLLLVLTDGAAKLSKRLGKLIKIVLGVSDEWDPISTKKRIIRGYFQNSQIVNEHKEEILETLSKSIQAIRRESEMIKRLLDKYPNYQLIHMRLGDFVNSKSGVISIESYRKIIDPKKPTFVCSDGSRESVLSIIDFHVDEILTPELLSAWETLCLMENASTFIGVNSTLSWWGAFLTTAKGNRAFLPDRWSKGSGLTDNKLLKLNESQSYHARYY